jgi:hypothetical protein
MNTATNSKIDFNAVAKEVNDQVNHYCRGRKRPDVSEEDLRGVAWVVALECLERFDPAKGAVGAYVGNILRKQLPNYMIESGAPCSGSIRHGRDALCAARSTRILADRSTNENGEREPGVVVEEPKSWADEVLADAGWHARIEKRLRATVGDAGQEGLAVLLGEAPAPNNGRTRASVKEARERVARDGWLGAYWGATEHERLVALRLALQELVPHMVAFAGGRAALEDLAATALRTGVTSDEMRAAHRKGKTRTPPERERAVLDLLRPGVTDPIGHLELCAALRSVFPGDEPGETYDAATKLQRVGVDAALLRKVSAGPGGWRDVAALLGEVWK